MVDGLKWDERETLPEDIKAAMRDLLAEALREAARKEDPGDGNMIFLSAGADKECDGGWRLQSSFVHDIRMNSEPFVVVHAYQDINVIKGSVSSAVVRTSEDLHYLGQRRLASMILERDRLNAAIGRLTAELEVER